MSLIATPGFHFCFFNLNLHSRQIHSKQFLRCLKTLIMFSICIRAITTQQSKVLKQGAKKSVRQDSYSFIKLAQVIEGLWCWSDLHLIYINKLITVTYHIHTSRFKFYTSISSLIPPSTQTACSNTTCSCICGSPASAMTRQQTIRGSNKSYKGTITSQGLMLEVVIRVDWHWDINWTINTRARHMMVLVPSTSFRVGIH